MPSTAVEGKQVVRHHEGMEWHESGLSVGQLAARMQIAPSAVRWYADHDLLPNERTSSNHRRFFADACCRIAMIRAAQRVGLSIAEIHEALAELPPRKVPKQQDWDRVAERLRSVLDARISELFRLLEELAPN